MTRKRLYELDLNDSDFVMRSKVYKKLKSLGLKDIARTFIGETENVGHFKLLSRCDYYADVISAYMGDTLCMRLI